VRIGASQHEWTAALRWGTVVGVCMVVVLVLFELALVDAGVSTQDAPSIVSYLLYPGMWLVLMILDWEADFSGISVLLGIVLDIFIYATGAAIWFAAISRRKNKIKVRQNRNGA